MIAWYNAERSAAIRGDYPNVRMYARERYIDMAYHSTETIKAWIRGLIKLKKKDERLKANDIRMYFL